MHGPFVKSIAAFAILFQCATAIAGQVNWTLSGVTFDDGGTASGSFIYDADSHTFSAWSISVAGGNTANFPAVTYGFPNSTVQSFNGGNPQDTILFALNGSARELRMTPTAALTDSAGTVALNLATAHNNSGGVECFNCGPARIITTGSLNGAIVPNAAAIPALSLSGLLLLIGSLIATAFGFRRRV